ncbi:phage holin family protein [Kineococcus gypseus]|uniref:phage holin family protein n=1 Tax=Kineococcus gypseus TaxID=1637102 RepID=UPI003D7D4E94
MTEQPRTAGQLVDDLTSDTVQLVRAEVERARRELLDKAREAGRGAALLGGAAVLGGLAAGTSAAFLVRTLGKVLPAPSAAFVATVLYGGGAAALGALGVEELRRVGSPLPQETIASVREDVRAARPGTNPVAPGTTGTTGAGTGAAPGL